MTTRMPDISNIPVADLTAAQAKAELKRLAAEIAAHDKHYYQDDAPTGEYNTLDYSFERMMTYCVVCQPAAFWTTRIARR